ncbi:hypothetical protein FI667_g7176, partial [Globisporangium splendens]
MRQANLDALGQALAGTKLADSATTIAREAVIKKDSCKAKGLDNAIEKLRIFKKLVDILSEKSMALEASCMQLEEHSHTQTQRLVEKVQHLKESQTNLDMYGEERSMTGWTFKNELTDIIKAESQMSILSERRQEVFVNVKDLTSILEEEQATLEFLAEMACPKLQQLEGTVASLSTKLKDLNDGMTTAKYHVREARLQVKQGKDIVSIKKANIKSKADQMNWLQRQKVYHADELKELVNKLTSDEAAFIVFVTSYKEQSDHLDMQLQETNDRIKELDAQYSYQKEAVKDMQTEAQAKTEALLLSCDACEPDKAELRRIEASINQLKAGAVKLKDDVVKKTMLCSDLENEGNHLGMQNEELLISAQLMHSKIRESKADLSAKEEELKAAAKCAKDKTDRLHIKRKSTVSVKSISKVIDQIQLEASQSLQQEENAHELVKQNLKEQALRLRQATKKKEDMMLAQVLAHGRNQPEAGIRTPNSNQRGSAGLEKARSKMVNTTSGLTNKQKIDKRPAETNLVLSTRNGACKENVPPNRNGYKSQQSTVMKNKSGSEANTTVVGAGRILPITYPSISEQVSSREDSSLHKVDELAQEKVVTYRRAPLSFVPTSRPKAKQPSPLKASVSHRNQEAEFEEINDDDPWVMPDSTSANHGGKGESPLREKQISKRNTSGILSLQCLYVTNSLCITED